MKEGLIIISLILAYMFNACADAIDHAKGQCDLYEIWHLFKAISYAIPFTIILWLLGVSWPVYPLFWVALWIYWEVTYEIALRNNIYKLDNNVRLSILKKIWRKWYR